MTTPPAGLTIEDLIRFVKGNPVKGGLTYADLAARRPVDEDGKPIGPDADRLEQIVNYGLKVISPPAVKGLAHMLRVSEETVLDACARSTGIKVNRKKSTLELLLPPGHERLPDHVVTTFLQMLALQIDALPPEDPEPEPEPIAPPPARRTTKATASKTTQATPPTRASTPRRTTKKT